MLRALFAVLVLPGVFAGLIPWLITRADKSRGDGFPDAIVLIVVGLIIFLFCVRDFFVVGKGTLAPWDPPKRLVVTGLYRFTRNPMYVGVILFLTGWALFVGSKALGWYLLILTLTFHLRVLLFEEPWLKRSFPEDWTAYFANVPRWLPRITPWTKLG